MLKQLAMTVQQSRHRQLFQPQARSVVQTARMNVHPKSQPQVRRWGYPIPMLGPWRQQFFGMYELQIRNPSTGVSLHTRTLSGLKPMTSLVSMLLAI
jgi:hypothetical protein